MKTVLMGAVVVAGMVAFAEDGYAHQDVSAKVSGYYDVTLTTKRLAHSEKTVTKTWSPKKKGKVVTSSAYDQFLQYCAEQGIGILDGQLKGPAGFEVVYLQADGVDAADEAALKAAEKKIAFKYIQFDYKTAKVYEGTGRNKVLVGVATNYVTKVVSESNKGLYDATTGLVYLWDTAAASKVSVTNGGANAIVASNLKRGVEQSQSGFVAYQVPLAMHRKFVATGDGKAAGGFTGSQAVAEDGTELNFTGLTAFGTGTMDTKASELKSVAGNVAMLDPADVKSGAYGTWKLQKDSSAKTQKAASLAEVLRNKGCVELFMEREDK